VGCSCQQSRPCFVFVAQPGIWHGLPMLRGMTVPKKSRWGLLKRSFSPFVGMYFLGYNYRGFTGLATKTPLGEIKQID